MTSLYGASQEILMGLGMVLTILAAATAWRSEEGTLARFIFAITCAMEVVGLAVIGVLVGRRPFQSPLLVMIAIGMATALWSFFLHSTDQVRAIGNFVVALTLGAYLFTPNVTWADVQIVGWSFGLVEVIYALAAGALLLGSIGAIILQSSATQRLPQSTLAIALLLQTIALVLQGTSAQLAWGAFWLWDPVECWHLAAWLATAMSTLAVHSLEVSRRRMRWAILLTTGFVLFILFATFPLVRWLGIQSRYLVR